MRGKIITAFATALFLWAADAPAEDKVRLLIMPSEELKKEVSKYADMDLYLDIHSSLTGKVQLQIAKNYPEAVRFFQSGEIDGMFSGSFVAAIFIKRGTAKPIVRPLLNNGVSTYRALIVAGKGTKPFSGIGDLRGKRVAYCALASSGEIFARTLLAPGETPESLFTPVITSTHHGALNALVNGEADYAMVKNLVWDPEKFKDLAVVGEDRLENPNNTLILTNAAFEKYGEGIRRALLRLGSDTSFGAMALKKSLGAKGFIATSEGDFAQTFKIIEKAHIQAEKFNFFF